MYKDIKGFEGYYMISSNGEVKSLDRTIFHDTYSRKIKGVILKPYVNGSGYLQVCLNKNGVSKLYFLHKLVAEAFVENPNNYTEVNHIDHNKLNCDHSNLEWVTRSQNMKSMREFYSHKFNNGRFTNIDFCTVCGKSYNSNNCKRCCSMECHLLYVGAKCKRPSIEDLTHDLYEIGFTKTGNKYSVSCNAVRKWCDYYGIPRHASHYKRK